MVMCIFNEPPGWLPPSQRCGNSALLEPRGRPSHMLGRAGDPPGSPPAPETLTGRSWDAARASGVAGSPDCCAVVVDARWPRWSSGVAGISSSHSTRDLLGVPITESPQASESASGVGFLHLLEARARTCSQKARSSGLSWVWTPEARDHTCEALLWAHPCLLGISGATQVQI